jgi:molybdenum cofactor biosynthesis protein B
MAHDGHDHKKDHEHGHGHGHHHHHPRAEHGHHGHSHAEKEHKAHAPAHVSVFVVTCSDSRDEARDESGRALRGGLEAAGHTVCGYKLIKDEPDAIRAVLAEAASSGARAVLFRADRRCGDDVPCYGRHLPGHDPLRDARLTQAVKLALEALILPELGHAIRELTR